MKDIDFDELDRAVSSVLEPTASADPAPDAKKTDAAPEVQTETPEVKAEAPSVATAPEAPVAEAVETAPAAVEADSVVVAPAAPRASLAMKRRGQFMDVVHPSSDMTKPEDAKIAVPPRKMTIKPLNDTVEPEKKEETETPPAPEPVVETAVPAPEVTPELQETAESVESFSIGSTMPDPLDVMQQQEEAKDAATETTPASEEMPAASIEETPIDASEEATPVTPFLSDTKVEKRPLDAFSAEETAPETEPDSAAETTEDGFDGTTPAEQIPPELQADVVAVESGQPDQLDKVEVEEEPVKEEPQDENAGTGFAASIPQQYTATDTKADDEHAIFDTREYHQPLAPATKKKRGLPGWIVALVVMVLLAALSAAGGYFWFYYGL